MPHPIDPTRAALLPRMLGHVPFEGWSWPAFRLAAREAGVSPEAARAACPRGPLDLAVEWHREGDRAMARAMREAPPGLRMRERVAGAVKARVAAMSDRESLRRSAALFALPQNAGLGARLLWETADAVWTGLGDASRDGNWYTKRATLAAVLASVALFRVGDDSPGTEATMAFVDRRIDDVMAFEGWKRSAGSNPVLRPVAAPLSWLMGRLRAPQRPADLPGQWRGEP